MNFPSGGDSALDQPRCWLLKMLWSSLQGEAVLHFFSNARQTVVGKEISVRLDLFIIGSEALVPKA